MKTNYDDIVLDTALIEGVTKECNTRDENDAKHPKSPGRQVGLYNDGTEKDIREAVQQLNNPGESGQNDRG